MSDIAPWSVAVHEGVGSLAGSAGNDAVHVNVVPEIVPESAPVLLRWQDAHVPGRSVDCVVTVPKTFSAVCVNFQVTSVVPIGVPLAPVLLFESTPVPVRICCGSCCDCCSGDPEPAPQATASTAEAVAVTIVRNGFMITPRSPPLTGIIRQTADRPLSSRLRPGGRDLSPISEEHHRRADGEHTEPHERVRAVVREARI